MQLWSNVNRLFGLSQLYDYPPPHNTRSDAFHLHSSSYHDHITQNWKKGKRRVENHPQQRCSSHYQLEFDIKGSDPRKEIGDTNTIKEAKKERSCRHRMHCGRSITFHNVRQKVKDGQLNILDVDLPLYIRRHPLLFFALPARRLGLTVILCQLQIPVGTDNV